MRSSKAPFPPLQMVLTVTVGILLFVGFTSGFPPRPRRISFAWNPVPGSGTSAIASKLSLRRLENHRALPLSFEPNLGQMREPVDFLSRGPLYTLFLTATEARFLLHSSSAPRGMRKGCASSSASVVCDGIHTTPSPAALRMRLVGANPDAAKQGLEELPGKVNYFLGNDPANWRNNIGSYAKVEYRAVYPGIDLVYHGAHRELEYDFIVAPKADPRAISLDFVDARALVLRPQGDLLIQA